LISRINSRDEYIPAAGARDEYTSSGAKIYFSYPSCRVQGRIYCISAVGPGMNISQLWGMG
jgi:hypothetical protein